MARKPDLTPRTGREVAVVPMSGNASVPEKPKKPWWMFPGAWRKQQLRESRKRRKDEHQKGAADRAARHARSSMLYTENQRKLLTLSFLLGKRTGVHQERRRSTREQDIRREERDEMTKRHEQVAAAGKTAVDQTVDTHSRLMGVHRDADSTNGNGRYPRPLRRP